MEKSKNIDKLKDFWAYCATHPNERFWQALRNWSEYNFIYGSKGLCDYDIQEEMEDTFYKE